MLVKILKQLIVTICLVSILCSSPAIAFASQNIKVHAPKGDLNITDKINNSDNISTIIGINNIIDDTNFFRIQNFQIGVTTCPRHVSIGEVVGHVMAVSVAKVADLIRVGN